jgi:hypothetical protein
MALDTQLMAQIVVEMSNAIAARSLPEDNEDFRQWSTEALMDRIREAAKDVIIQYLSRYADRLQ